MLSPLRQPYTSNKVCLLKLAMIPKAMFILKATGQYPNNVNKQDIDRVLARGRSETGGLDYELHLKETARVMLTANIDIADRLINGQIGTVVKICQSKYSKAVNNIH